MIDGRIVLTLSGSTIAFEHSKDDRTLLPLGKGDGRAVPLAFYIDPMSRVEVGEEAEEAMCNGLPNTYGNYFRRSDLTASIPLANHSRRVADLPLCAVEGMMEELGEAFPRRILIVTHDDISDEAQQELKEVFIKGDFEAKTERYNTYLGRHLAQENRLPFSLSARLLGDSLSLTLFRKDQPTQFETVTLAGESSGDPRVETACQEIWRQIQPYAWGADYDSMKETLTAAAVDFLQSGKIERTGDIDVNGFPCTYNLQIRAIDAKTVTSGPGIDVRLTDFLSANNCADRSRIMLLLSPEVAANQYYVGKLNNGFARVEQESKSFLQGMKGMMASDAFVTDMPVPPTIDMPKEPRTFGGGFNFGGGGFGQPKEETPTSEPPTQTPPGPPVPPPLPTPEKMARDEWRNVCASVDALVNSGKLELAEARLIQFRDKIRSVNVPDVHREIEAELKGLTPPPPPSTMTPPPPPPPAVDERRIKALLREWKVTRAAVKGKVTLGKYTDAKNMLKELLSKCTISGSESLKREIETDLKAIPEAPAVNPETVRKLDAEFREMRGDLRRLIKTGDCRQAQQMIETFRKKCQKEGVTELDSKIEAFLSDIPAAPRAARPESPNSTQQDQGKMMLAEGKLSDARDWYEGKGDRDTASVIRNLMRMERNLKPRKKEIGLHKSDPDCVKIKEIINELNDYINACAEIGANCDEYSALRKQYKQIR